MSVVVYGATPRRAYLYPTNRCNLACPACYSREPKFGDAGRSELSTGEYRDLLDALYRGGVREFDFSGGEPLLRADLFQILEAAARPEATVLMVTNGSLLAERVDRHAPDGGFGCVSRLYVSLDGPNADLHDRLRGQNGIFDSAMQGLAALRATGFGRIGVNMLAQPGNVETVPQLLDLALDQQARYVQVLRAIDVGANSAPASGFKAEADLESLYCSLLDALERRAHRAARHGLEVDLVLPGYDLVRYLSYRRRPSLPENVIFRVHHDPMRGCLAFVNAVAITAFGQVTGCTAMVRYPALHLGDVRHMDIASMLATWPDQHRRLIRTREELLRNAEPCRSCDAWSVCRGGCPVVALKYHGTVNRPDPSCGRGT